MRAFKKKTQIPETIVDLNKKMSMLLGNIDSQATPYHQKGRITRQLILACAMFWNSKQRIDKIKGLILKEQNLMTFEDADDFKIEELQQIELLSLSRNQIINLHPIGALRTLICLNVNYNQIHDLSPLSNLPLLQQLYASNNQIEIIDPIKNLRKLRIINFYSNKIRYISDAVNSLRKLQVLEELDVEENPCYEEKNREQFLKNLNLSRFNGQLVLQQEKPDKQLSASCVVIPSAKFRDTHTSFWNSKSNEKPSNVSTVMGQSCSEWSIINKNCSYKETIENLKESSINLQLQYLEIDDQVESQIVRNVQLKSQLHKTLILKQQKQANQSEAIKKSDDLKCLKRKVKSLKENLFNPEVSGLSKRKCDLLRQIFELEMMKQTKNKTKDDPVLENTNIVSNHSWVRRFDWDEEIFIGASTKKKEDDSNDKYLMDDMEIQQLLEDNSSAIEDLKQELRQLANS